MEFDANISIHDTRPPATIVAERLARLASGAIEMAAKLSEAGIQIPTKDESDIEDAEIVEE
jgi:hypothetical protein